MPAVRQSGTKPIAHRRAVPTHLRCSNLDEIDFEATRVMGGIQGQSVVQMEDKSRSCAASDWDWCSTFVIAFRSASHAEYVLAHDSCRTGEALTAEMTQFLVPACETR